MIHLLALIATVPVIVAFQVGALLSFAWCVTQLLGEPDTAGTAEQEEGRRDLEPTWACDKEEVAFGDPDLTLEGTFEGVDPHLQYASTFLAGGGFLGEG